MSTALAIIQQPPKPLIQIIDSPVTLTIQPELAAEIGLSESIVLRQIAFWIKTSNNCRDGQWWTYQSLSEMRDKAFKFWSVSTISRVVNKLVELGLIEKTDRYNPRRNDRTQWFALAIEKLQELTSVKVILQDAKQHITKPVKVLQDETASITNPITVLQNETGILQSATTLPEITTERKEKDSPQPPEGEVAVDDNTNKAPQAKGPDTDLEAMKYAVRKHLKAYGDTGEKIAKTLLNRHTGKSAKYNLGDDPAKPEDVEAFALWWDKHNTDWRSNKPLTRPCNMGSVQNWVNVWRAEKDKPPEYPKPIKRSATLEELRPSRPTNTPEQLGQRSSA